MNFVLQKVGVDIDVCVGMGTGVSVGVGTGGGVDVGVGVCVGVGTDVCVGVGTGVHGGGQMMVKVPKSFPDSPKIKFGAQG